jgi:hypothetical protein
VCACERGLHPLCEPACLGQFLEGQAPCVSVVRTVRTKLLVVVIQMLRQFFDNLGFPGRTEAQFGQSSTKVVTPGQA